MSRRFKPDLELLLVAAGVAVLLAVRLWDARRRPAPPPPLMATPVDTEGLRQLMRRNHPTPEDQRREDSWRRAAEDLDRAYNGPKPPPARATWVKRPLDDAQPSGKR